MKLNKKKGFTLIELLAVIVVLAIIALIATPIVMNTIEKSKKSTVIESANNLIKSAEYYILQTKNRYGKVSVLNEKLNYSGNKPDLGEVEINKDGKSRIYTYLNGYCVTKDYENKSPYATKTSKEECNWFATDNYETTEGSIITINNGNIKNYLIYGNSTQETRSGKNILNMANFTTSYTNSYFEDKATNFKLTAGKTYTISFNYRVLSAGGTLSTGVGYGTTGYSADIVYGKVYPNQTTGRQSVTFTVPSNLADGNYLFVRFARTGSATSASVAISSIQLEEGSTVTEYEPYGAMPSPEFPSEINNTGDLITKDNCASYGSDACNSVGKYVVQVKATGKNILDISKLEAGAYSTGLTQSSNTFSFKRTGTKNTSSIFTKIKLEAGTYTISGNLTQSDGLNGGYGVYDLEKQEYLVNRSSSGIGTSTFTVPESKIYSLGFFCNYNSVEGTQVTYSNIQLEYASSATTYEPYREATTNIYLDEPLIKVGDYVDYIDYANGKVVRNIKQINLSDLLWTKSENAFYSNVIDDVADEINSTKIKSDKFTAQAKTTDNSIYINHKKVYVWNSSYSDISQFKTIINNSKLYYISTNQTEESISLPQIKTVEGTNYITVNTSTSASNLKITTEK